MNLHLSDIDMPLGPGIVYFLTPDGAPDGAPDLWQPYLSRLRMAAARHRLKVVTARTAGAATTFTTVARRFNLANLTYEAYAFIRGEFGPTVAMASLENFLDNLSWIRSMQEGDIDLTDNGFLDIPFEDSCKYASAPDVAPCGALPDSAVEDSPRRRSFLSRLAGRLRHGEEEPEDEDTADDEDSDLLSSIDAEQQEMLSRLAQLVADYVYRYNRMPPLEKFLHSYHGKFIIPTDPGRPFSPVVVNGNLDITLPYYNELTFKFTPLLKTLYLLFLLHPEGLKIKNLADYRPELEEIYLLVKPGASDKLARRSISDLCDPLSGSADQKLSMIRRIVKKQLMTDRLTAYYSISGRRGEPYRLPAAGDVALPSIIKSLIISGV